jgi:putative transposase
MTKVRVEGVGWMYIVVVLDWQTKTIVGSNVGMHGQPQHGPAHLR